jgi:hypothetical protein
MFSVKLYHKLTARVPDLGFYDFTESEKFKKFVLIVEFRPNTTDIHFPKICINSERLLVLVCAEHLEGG